MQKHTLPFIAHVPALRPFLAILLFTVTSFALPGCDAKTAPTPAPATTLRVLAASSLTDACTEIAAAFEAANPGTTITLSFGGSNQLRTQLDNGSPGDVFISADTAQMDAAATSKVIDASTRRTVAFNTLALITPRANPAKITAMADLARPGLKLIVADKAVPAGAYTRRLLESARSTMGDATIAAIEANIVSFEENAAGVVAKVALNEADAGFAYASDAAGGNGTKLLVIPLPVDLQQRAEYSAAVTTRTAAAPQAARFIAFLTSPDAATLLAKRGFTPAP